MSDPNPPAEQMSAWAATAHRRRLNLHLKAASPSARDRETAFAGMAALAAEAIAITVRAANHASRSMSERTVHPAAVGG